MKYAFRVERRLIYLYRATSSNGNVIANCERKKAMIVKTTNAY